MQNKLNDSNITNLCLSQPGTYLSAEGTIADRSSLAKACGQNKFPSDMTVPGALIGIPLFSPYPHCQINAIRTEKAQQLPGVCSIITWKDIPGINKDIKTIADQPFLAEDRARTVMDVLALIAAENEDAIIAAIRAIELDLTPLPVVSDVDTALTVGSPQVHPGGNLAYEFKITHGDVKVGMAEADVIVENVYVFPWIDHAYLETEAALAAPGDDGTMTVWLGSHDIYSDRLGMSLGFGWPEERFRVVLVPPGGSFGGKHVPIGFFAALLAHSTGKPVKIHYSRRQSLTGHAKRSPMRIYHKLGARSSGHLTAAEVNIVSDTGAYVHWAPLIIDFCCIHATGPYRIPHAQVRGSLIYTNNIVGSGMRGLGTPQVEFAAESQMDILASLLHIHPLKLRWMNALREGDTIITGKLAPGCRFENTIESAAKLVGLELIEVQK